jgi:hypothetical protein
MTRLLLTILRKADGPMTVRDLAIAIAQEHGLDASAAGLRPLIANLRNALCRPLDGIESSEGADGVMVWIARTM